MSQTKIWETRFVFAAYDVKIISDTSTVAAILPIYLCSYLLLV